jgi:hypothetical protein
MTLLKREPVGLARALIVAVWIAVLAYVGFLAYRIFGSVLIIDCRQGTVDRMLVQRPRHFPLAEAPASCRQECECESG